MAGLVASLPVVGPALAGLCLACVGFGGAALGALAGATAAIGGPVAAAAGGIVLLLFAWRAFRRARPLSAGAHRRFVVRTAMVLLGGALATYLLATFVLAPLMVRAIEALTGTGDGPILP